MLVLHRRYGQTLVLETTDGDIVIHFEKPNNHDGRGMVKLAIEAPTAVGVRRGELPLNAGE